MREPSYRVARELDRKANFEANLFTALVVIAICGLVAGGYLWLS